MSGWHALLSQLPFEWAQYAFMHNALLAVLLVTPLFAVLGCMVINNQMAFFSEAIGHAALTGIAIGVLLGLANPIWAMLIFAVLLALGISALRHYSAASADTIIGLVMSFAVALGVVLLSRGGSFSKFTRYLIGDLLTVSPAELLSLLALLALVLAAWILFFNRLFLTVLNRPLARSRGINVWLMEGIFSALVAIVVTVSIPWVGLLVINSLLILPAAAARNLAGNTAQYHVYSILFAVISGVIGLIISFHFGTAAGATIVLVCMAFFVTSMVLRKH